MKRRGHDRMNHPVRNVLRREGFLLLVCVFSDVLPKLVAGRLGARGALWSAIIDNASHASIAAASWVVVVAISPSPGFRVVQPGSDLHRCVSYALYRLRGQRRRGAKLIPTKATPSPKSGDLEEMADHSLLAWPDRGQARAAHAAQANDAAHAAAAGRERRMRSTRKEVFFTACCGSMLDFDHFLAAGSLRLSSATTLAERPWGHCVAAVVLAAFLVLAVTRNRRAAASVFSAGASHQLRDATRRGLWLYPPRGPSTPPIGYPMYLLAQTLLPAVVALILRWDAAAGGGSRSFQGMRHRYRGHAALADDGSIAERGPSSMAV